MPPEAMPSNNDSAIGMDPQVDAAKHDVWSLGQLALNLFLQVSAWHSPQPSDPCFRFYSANPHSNLMRYLRITPQFNHILTECWVKRCSASTLLQLVQECDDFVCPVDEFIRRRDHWDTAFDDGFVASPQASSESETVSESFSSSSSSSSSEEKKVSMWGKLKRFRIK